MCYVHDGMWSPCKILIRFWIIIYQCENSFGSFNLVSFTLKSLSWNFHTENLKWNFILTNKQTYPLNPNERHIQYLPNKKVIVSL